MSVHESTYNALKEMGIDPIIAREAASRFHNVEPAVNWCFGDGANWTPPPPKPEGPPVYESWRPQRAHGTSVEHREVIDIDAPSSIEPSPPPLPPSSQIQPTTTNNQFASNNPFRQTPQSAPTLPPRRNIAPAPSSIPTLIDDNDEDEDLRRAIELSQSEINPNTDGNDEGRQDRERSVRATGPPPPSPTGAVTAQGDNDHNQIDHSESLNTLFGPSNKDDVDGNMALVPSTQNNPSSMSKEDEDMDRAIQESLMTASFHSASGVKDTNKATPKERLEGAPLVLYSESGHSTYAANFLQAMYAVPQLREAVANVMASNQAAEISYKGKLIEQIYDSYQTTTSSFIEVDDQLKSIRDGREPNQLPPNQPGVDLHRQFAYEITYLMLQAGSSSTPDQPQAIATFQPEHLFDTHVDGDQPQQSLFVTFNRSAHISHDIYSHLSSILWSSDSTTQSLISLGDILTVMLEWLPGAKREIWKLDERIVLDRFMKENAVYAAQKRAYQSVMAGNARRTQEKIDRLTTYEGNDYQQSISTLIEHLDNTPITDDKMQNESRSEMKEKLQRILSILQQEVTKDKAELEQYNQAASGSLFETDDPKYNQHVYILRGILFHDGALVGGNHLYSYIRGEDGRWWKIQEHEIETVDWETIVSDKTGLWMEGGAYMLIYSRDGPRPSPPPSSTSSSITPSPLPTESESEYESQSPQKPSDLRPELSPTKTIREMNLPPSSQSSLSQSEIGTSTDYSTLQDEGDLIDISMTNSSTSNSTRQGTPIGSDIEMTSTTTLAGDPQLKKQENLMDLE